MPAINITRVRDFTAGEDVLDISMIIDNTAYDPVNDALSDFVAMVDNGTHTYVRVNEAGSGITSEYTTVMMPGG